MLELSFEQFVLEESFKNTYFSRQLPSTLI